MVLFYMSQSVVVVKMANQQQKSPALAGLFVFVSVRKNFS